MRNVLLLVVFIAAILPAPCSLASTNSFIDADADALLKLENAVLTLEGDINQSASTLNNQFNDFAQEQTACLLELEQSVANISTELNIVRELVALSVQMETPHDAANINSLLVIDAKSALKTITSARKYSLTQAATCSTSALVNTYSQKSVALADHATAAISAIKDRLASNTNSQDHQ